MRAIKQMTIIFFISLSVAACATAPITLAPKYNLGDELIEVAEIFKFRMSGWETVDNQSFILQTGPSEYYLIVLRRPAHNLVFTESIGISNTGQMVKPGYDKVIVEDSAGQESYIIHKIYKLENQKQAKEIKEKLG